MISKPNIYKRIIAYVVDIFIVLMLASIITMVFPSNDEYNTSLTDLTSITEKYEKEEISSEEYYALYDDINYDLAKNSVEMTIVIVAISLLYFVLFNYYNDGMTIGKKLMKIKIVSANDNELTINRYLLRSLIINSSFANIVSVILILSLSKENYILYNNKISTLFTVIYVLCFIFIVYRNDGRGLHELIAGTKVINIKTANNIEIIKETEMVDEDNNLKNQISIEEKVLLKEEVKEKKSKGNKTVKNKTNNSKSKKEKGSDK